jgi:hypothetical protein
VALTSGHLVRGIDPFELFCAYHLGLTAAGAYKFQNVHDVARRFHVEPTDIEDALRAYGLDTERLLSSSFDTASAQVDIQVSPPGVDLVGLAQMHWEALLDSQENARDWKRELADDEAENARTFGAAERNDDEA